VTGGETAHRRGPLLVELMGLAGSGKSTVFEDLLRRRPELEPRPVITRRDRVPETVRTVASVLAYLVRARAITRRTRPQDVRLMTYLQALPRVLDREGCPERTIVFDQGPIYLLARPRLQGERLRPWWDRTFDDWAERLDAVVCLDAPDEVLLERIDGREKRHALKGREHEPAREALTRTRAVYEDALARLESRPLPPTILRFDTSRETAGDVVDGILALLEAMRAGQRAPEPAPPDVPGGAGHASLRP
jgi:thymidylate kinase